MPLNFELTPVPDTLAEAVEAIANALTEDELEFIRGDSEPAMLHHTVGMAMRNGWQLWQRGTALHEHFRETYGLGHADDMSSIVMSGVWAKVRGEPHDIDGDVEKFKEHWRSCGQDPLMET